MMSLGDYALAKRLDDLNVFPMLTANARRQRYDLSAANGAVSQTRSAVSRGSRQPPAHRQKGGAEMLTVIEQFKMWLQVHRGSDEGATAVEYGLMIALIAAVIMVTVATLGGHLNTLFGSV